MCQNDTRNFKRKCQGGGEIFQTFGGYRGQNVLRFVCSFQVKFNFSIVTFFFFFQSSIMTSKIY